MQAECLVARLRLQRQYSLYAGQMKTHGVHHWSAPFEVRRLVRHWLPRVFRSAFEHCVGRQNVRNYRAPPVEMLDVYPPKSIGSVERESGTPGEAELNRCLRCRGIRNVDSLGPVRGKGVQPLRFDLALWELSTQALRARPKVKGCAIRGGLQYLQVLPCCS
jgi:hypothetical protein